jgi:hypothetical protein
MSPNYLTLSRLQISSLNRPTSVPSVSAPLRDHIMPILHFNNKSNKTLNIGAFLSGFPSLYRNSLAPGQEWAQDYPSLPFSSLEARIDNGSNQFAPDDAAKDVGTLAGAVGMGTASVLKGTGAVVGAFPTGAAAKGGTGKAMEDAGELMRSAGRGKSSTQSKALTCGLMSNNRGHCIWTGRRRCLPPGTRFQCWF